MSQSDFGSTFEIVNGGFTPSMRLLTTDAGKLQGLLNALVSRVKQPAGSLWYDPNYGYGLATLLEDEEDPDVAAQLINQCFKQDERVASSVTTITVAGNEWNINSIVTAQDGTTYQLVFEASAGQVELLTAKQGS